MANYKDEQQQAGAFQEPTEKSEEKAGSFLKKAFQDMKETAKAQHAVDKANFEAVKAESKANFEENRGYNTFAKAKADAKKSWDEAHMSPSERTAKMQEERDLQIAEAKKRQAEAESRINAAKGRK